MENRTDSSIAHVVDRASLSHDGWYSEAIRHNYSWNISQLTFFANIFVDAPCRFQHLYTPSTWSFPASNRPIPFTDINQPFFPIFTLFHLLRPITCVVQFNFNPCVCYIVWYTWIQHRLFTQPPTCPPSLNSKRKNPCATPTNNSTGTHPPFLCQASAKARPCGRVGRVVALSKKKRKEGSNRKSHMHMQMKRWV